MQKKDFIRIINEEISDFDFLNNDKYQKEKESVDILNNEDFQKQFICDSLLNKQNKIKIDVTESTIGGDWENSPEDTSTLTIRYFLNIEYSYDQEKEPIVFDLDFYSDNISIGKEESDNISTDSYTQQTNDEWFNSFDWGDINVTLNTTNGDEIDFKAFRIAPNKIKVLFIREYIADYISNHTNLDIRTPEMKDNIQNIPYC